MVRGEGQNYYFTGPSLIILVENVRLLGKGCFSPCGVHCGEALVKGTEKGYLCVMDLLVWR